MVQAFWNKTKTQVVEKSTNILKFSVETAFD